MASQVPKVVHKMKNLIPMFDRVIIRKEEPITRTASGIELPEGNSKSKVLEGTVIAVGPGNLNVNGDIIPTTLKVGDKVLLPQFNGDKIKYDDEELHIYHESDIAAKIE